MLPITYSIIMIDDVYVKTVVDGDCS